MGELPLYQGAGSASLTQEANGGLWYDKFCHSWGGFPARDQKLDLDKRQWIDTVVGSRGIGSELQQHAERQARMIEILNGKWLDLQTESPFVSGLGRDHPVENGFAWHYTLGVPYLPGSSVKGMVRAWATQWTEVEEATRLRILGPKPPAGTAAMEPQVGEMIFLDAVPTSPVELAADVMTPHYDGYYQKGETPGDWMSPIPIPFLVVKAGATFRFPVAPRQQSEQSREDSMTAFDWLKEALEWIGAGAKTAVGYGRMRVDRDAQIRSEKERKDRRNREQAQAALEEIIRDLPQDAAWLERRRQEGRWTETNNFLDDAESCLADNRKISKEAHKLLTEEVATRWPGIIDYPDAVTGKRKKPKYRPRPRELARLLNARGGDWHMARSANEP